MKSVGMLALIILFSAPLANADGVKADSMEAYGNFVRFFGVYYNYQGKRVEIDENALDSKSPVLCAKLLGEPENHFLSPGHEYFRVSIPAGQSQVSLATYDPKKGVFAITQTTYGYGVSEAYCMRRNNFPGQPTNQTQITVSGNQATISEPKILAKGAWVNAFTAASSPTLLNFLCLTYGYATATHAILEATVAQTTDFTLSVGNITENSYFSYRLITNPKAQLLERVSEITCSK